MLNCTYKQLYLGKKYDKVTMNVLSKNSLQSWPLKFYVKKFT